MSSNDLLHRFIFDHCDIRGEIVTLTDSYREVLANNPYPAEVQALLGEFLVAVSLLSNTLKFDGTIILQARGEGAVSTIMAECSNQKNLRAIVRLNPERSLTPQTSGNFKQMLGRGVLVITIEPKRAENFQGKLERYQGIVPMEADSLAGCLEHYFEQSEQLATRLWIATDSQHASGLMIQALPQQLHTNPEDNRAHWETITTLAATTTDEELCTLEHTELLYRLFHEESVRVFDPDALQFSCSCSRERSAGALMSLGKDEVEALLVEQGTISIDCQFCNQHYAFDSADVRELLGGDVLH